MGKTFTAAKGEVAKCAFTMRYYAEHAEAMLRDEAVSTSGSRSGIRYDPIGAVLAVMPWNYPLWQFIRVAAPTVMAGNVMVLKHASNVPGCAKFIEDSSPARVPEGHRDDALRESRQVRASSRTAHRRGDAHGIGPRRSFGGRDRRAAPEEVRARVGRL